MDPFRLHLRGKAGKIRKGLPIHREVLIVIHVVDIQVNGVQREPGLVIAADDVPYRFSIRVTPAGLLEAESPERRNVAFSDQGAEFADDVTRRLPENQIDLKILSVQGDHGLIRAGISDVPADLRRKIDEDPAAVMKQEIVRGIEGLFLLRMQIVIAAEAPIDPAAFVDPARRFAEPVHDPVLLQREGKDKAPAVRAMREREAVHAFGRQPANHGAGHDRPS